MILLADSGSTKCDWLLLNDNYQEEVRFYTNGINPQVQTTESIGYTIGSNHELTAYANTVKKVHYYGAGCSSAQLCAMVEQGIKQYFEKAEIEVQHDLLGAARALYSGEAIIACILGTGSNSCSFNGNDLWQNTPSLGYILGDEGSGSFFGKTLLRDYLYGRLPENMSQHMKLKYQLDLQDVLFEIFKKPRPNVYLASFARVISEFKDESYVQDLLTLGFTQFLNYHVLAYPEAKKYKIAFTGSVAYTFRDELKACCEALGLEFSHCIRKPIDGMMKYHKNFR